MCSVAFSSVSSDGIDFTITISKTGPSTANISIKSSENGAEHNDTYNVYNVTASAAKMLFVRQSVLLWHPTLACTIDNTRPPGAATVSITVANAPAHNGTTPIQSRRDRWPEDRAVRRCSWFSSTNAVAATSLRTARSHS